VHEPEEHDEVESEGSRHGSPIDEDFDGELNAALPEEPDDEEDKDVKDAEE
jgi:hypothetical protein